jgi:hypothetical protein
VARAKRTDRAEARRQYRAYLAAQAEVEAADGTAAEEDAVPVESRGLAARFLGSQPQTQAQPVVARVPGERMGMFSGAKAAFRQPHYIDDLRNVGPLVFRTKAIWPVAALCLIAALISYPRVNATTDTANDPILSVTFQFILYPLPLLPPMIAGFFAPRSTWLAGAIAAAISTLTLVALLWSTGLPIQQGTISVNSGNVIGVTLGWLSAAIPFGALIGAASGWYKRFLDNMGTGQRRSAAKSSAKRPVRRSSPAKRPAR